jgi:hypothetical protein
MSEIPATPPQPVLAPPGAGLPLPARWIVRLLGRRLLRAKYTVDEALLDVQRTAANMLQRAAVLSDTEFNTRVLVPRLRGLEDSSRFWSPGMVLEHLCITSSAMVKLAVGLSNGHTIDDVVSTAAVKPTGNLGRAVLDDFEAIHFGVGDRVRAALGKEMNTRTHRHPWFGPLTASDWLRLLAGHARIHQRQLHHILQHRQA